MPTYRVRAEPNFEQQRWAAQAAGMNRWVYNEARKHCKEGWKKGIKYPGVVGLCTLLTAWRKEHSWLQEGNAQAQQQSLIDFDNAMQRAFKKLGGLPKKKTRRRNDPTIRFPQGDRTEIKKLSGGDSHIKLPGLGWLRFRHSQKVEGNTRNVSLRRNRLYQWHLVIRTELGTPEIIPELTTLFPDVGIDLGVKISVARTGSEYGPGIHESVPTPSKKDEKHHAKLQRRLSRRQKGSKRRERARLAIAKYEQRWRDRKKDFLHKLSTTIVRENQAIYVEDLDVKSMTKKCKGKGRAAKAGLNKAILQQGWGEFRQFLQYKSAKRGKFYAKVPPAYTSQTCCQCGYTDPLNRASQAVFLCGACRQKMNADDNAAINIRAAGRAASVRGRLVRPVVSVASARSRLAGRLKRKPPERPT